jgi:hypothetical protein
MPHNLSSARKSLSGAAADAADAAGVVVDAAGEAAEVAEAAEAAAGPGVAVGFVRPDSSGLIEFDCSKALRPVRQLGDVRCDPAHLLVLRVAFRLFVGDYLRRSRPRVQIAKAAITGEYVAQMVARLECTVLAVPVHSALSDVNHRAPRGITISCAGRGPKRHRRGERSHAKCQFRKGHHGA